MITVQGKYNTANIYSDTVDETTVGQVIELCNQRSMSDTNIRIMPDCHAGAGCVIGTTFQLTNKVVPNLVGVDIGCGMHVVYLGQVNLDFAKLDSVIREYVPSGFSVRSIEHWFSKKYVRYNDLIAPDLNLSRAKLSVGTLGGGNHFIEVDVDSDGNYYLVIHSGSRNLGKQVAEYWQSQAIVQRKAQYDLEKEIILKNHKSSGNFTGMQDELNALGKVPSDDLCYVDGKLFAGYMNDMHICQEFATQNRLAMANVIMNGMGIQAVESFTTIHNYIDSNLMLRKGAVSAKLGEKLIIPINMRDGSIIATGKGNKDWNESAPHGAGRLFGRGQAKRSLSLDEFQKTMEGIYTTCVGQDTLDESPMAYKSLEEIAINTVDTIEIKKIIKPVYNFKSSGN